MLCNNKYTDVLFKVFNGNYMDDELFNAFHNEIFKYHYENKDKKRKINDDDDKTMLNKRNCC